MPNGVIPNQLPHPLTRAHGGMAARRTTGQSVVASARTGLTGSNGQKKKRRKRGRERRREVKGRRSRIVVENAQKSLVRKSDPGYRLVRFKAYELQMGGGAIDW